jgi:hypothetical protein
MNWREYIPFEEGLAFILALVTIVLPLRAHLYYPDLLGEYEILKLLVIAAVGGAVSFGLYVGPGERLLAVVPGLVAGFGAAALYLACARFGLPMRHWMLRYAALGTGAAPGLFLMWLFRRVVYRHNRR